MEERGSQTRAQFLILGPVFLGATPQLPRKQPHLLLVLWQGCASTISRRVQESPEPPAKASQMPAFPIGSEAAGCSWSARNSGFTLTPCACQPSRLAGLGNGPVMGPSLGAKLSPQSTMSSDQWCTEGTRPSQFGAAKWDSWGSLNDTS